LAGLPGAVTLNGGAAFALIRGALVREKWALPSGGGL